MGPWHHGQEIARRQRARRAASSTATPRSTSAARSCGRSSTSYLKDGAPKADVAPVTAFETGTNTWRRLPAWPAGCATGCTVEPTPLYLARRAGSSSFAAPKAGDAAFEEYVSDPAKPVPFRARPIQPIGYDSGADLAAVAGGRPARGVRPAGRRWRSSSDVADRAGEDQRTAGREPGRLDERHRLRLGREADRRLSRRGGRPAGDGRLSADGVGRHLPRPLPREPRDAEGDRRRTSRCSTASRCRRRTTSSCRATGSWCRCSRAGSRSTTATRRRSCRTSSGRSRRTTGRPRSAIYHAPGQASFVELPLIRTP